VPPPLADWSPEVVAVVVRARNEYQSAKQEFESALRELDDARAAWADLYNLEVSRSVRRYRPFRVARAAAAWALDDASDHSWPAIIKTAVDQFRIAATGMGDLVEVFWEAVTVLLRAYNSYVCWALSRVTVDALSAIDRRSSPLANIPPPPDLGPPGHLAAVSPIAAHAPPVVRLDVPKSTPAAVALAA
jgi:hypothetical protein